jgi:thiamine kinase-like enzyme
MRPRDAQTIARRAVPGSGEPSSRRLGSGLLNDTYRVDRDGRAFSLRIAVESSPASRRDRDWEFAVLKEAARRGLAPPLVYADAECGFLVQEWVAGRPWLAPEARQATNIARMAGLLKRVHDLPQPAPARIMGPATWVERYGAALADASVPAPGAAFASLAAAAAERLSSLEALPAPAKVVCHSDLHHLNLLECPGPGGAARSLKLLDWEYAHVSEPFWDLAGWSANNDFPDRLLRALLRDYLGRMPQESEWSRCKLLSWLYDYVCLLWSELYLHSRRGGAADGAGRSGIAARAGVLKERLAAQ